MNQSTCPSCGCSQPHGLLCSQDTAALEGMLRAIPALVEQLDIAISKQARLTSGGRGSKGAAHEQWPINFDSVEAADALLRTLDRWARVVAVRNASEGQPFAYTATATKAATFLLDQVDNIRRHPDAARIVSSIGQAIKTTYSRIDRMQEREYLGQCLYEEDGLTCHAEIWARPGAHQVTCTQCEITHEVAERRAWLLVKAADMIVTVKEASSYLGEIGGIKVTESSIRGYLHRGSRLAYRPPLEAKRFRLGDLLDVVMDESERRSA